MRGERLGRLLATMILGLGVAFQHGGGYARGAKGKGNKMPATDVRLPFVEQDQAPEPLFIEKKTSRPLSQPKAKRVLLDGTVWTYYGMGVILKDGRYQSFDKLPSKWRWTGDRLSKEEMENLQEVIRREVMCLPSEIPVGEEGVIGGTDVYWTVHLDGKTHTIHWVQGGASMPPGLEKLDSMLTDYINNAIERWHREYDPWLDSR